MFLEFDFSPNDQQKNLISFVVTDNFPWYLQDTITHEENGKLVCKEKALIHSLRKRVSTENWGIKTSQYTDLFEGIFLQACAQNNITPKIIYRSVVNLTTYNSNKHSVIHKDHEFPHYNFIYYLNTFTKAPTYVFDEDEKTILYESNPSKNNIFVFPGLPHAQGFCAENEHRIVFVVTYS